MSSKNMKETNNLINNIMDILNDHADTLNESKQIIASLENKLLTEKNRMECCFNIENLSNQNKNMLSRMNATNDKSENKFSIKTDNIIQEQASSSNDKLNDKNKFYLQLAQYLMGIIKSNDKTINAESSLSELVIKLYERLQNLNADLTTLNKNNILEFIEKNDDLIEDYFNKQCKQKIIDCLMSKLTAERNEISKRFSALSIQPNLKPSNSVNENIPELIEEKLPASFNESLDNKNVAILGAPINGTSVNGLPKSSYERKSSKSERKQSKTLSNTETSEIHNKTSVTVEVDSDKNNKPISSYDNENDYIQSSIGLVPHSSFAIKKSHSGLHSIDNDDVSKESNIVEVIDNKSKSKTSEISKMSNQKEDSQKSSTKPSFNFLDPDAGTITESGSIVYNEMLIDQIKSLSRLKDSGIDIKEPSIYNLFQKKRTRNIDDILSEKIPIRGSRTGFATSELIEALDNALEELESNVRKRIMEKCSVQKSLRSLT